MSMIDGTWIRVLPDDTLEMRDPNDGIGFDPRTKSRYQFRVIDRSLLVRRRLPPDSVSDRFRDDDIDAPWWEPVLEISLHSPVAEYAEGRLSVPLYRYAMEAQYIAGHVVAYTPNGREVRHHRDGGLEVQPHSDNYWLRASDLRGARRAYFGR